MKKCVLFASIVLAITGAASATLLPVANHDFEVGNPYPAGLNGQGWGASAGIYMFPKSPTPNGSPQACLFNSNASSQAIYQTVESTIQAGYTYTLTADFCNGRTDLAEHWTTLSMQLWAKDASGDPTDLLFNDLTYYDDFTAAEQWIEVSNSYTDDGTYAGRNLILQFQILGGWQPWLDNVRLDEVPEPATMALLMLGGVGLLRRRR